MLGDIVNNAPENPDIFSSHCLKHVLKLPIKPVESHKCHAVTSMEWLNSEFSIPFGCLLWTLPLTFQHFCITDKQELVFATNSILQSYLA